MQRHSQLHRSSTQGFTLIELLVVIIIVGVLAAIAAPSWLAFMNRQRIGAVRADLVSTLNTLRKEAEQKRNYQTIWLDFTSPTPALRHSTTVTASPSTMISQPLGGDSLPPNSLLLRAYYVDPTTKAWVEIDSDPTVNPTALTAPCNALNKACFQFNYRGIPTNPSAEMLPYGAANYVTATRVPFRIDIVTARNPTGSSRQCVIIADVLGSLKSETGADCDKTPTALGLL